LHHERGITKIRKESQFLKVPGLLMTCGVSRQEEVFKRKSCEDTRFEAYM
jgi:hypothetical protein